MSTNRMIVINNVRYRRDDAYRLGLITDGAAITARSKNTGQESAGAPVSEDPATPAANTTTGGQQARPARNASRDEWVAYAKSQGVLETDIEGLKRDEISEMFPDEPADNE